LSPSAFNASPAWPGDCYAKGPSHHVRHLWSHHGLCASVQTTRRCRPTGTHFGHGQNTVLGWSDPHFSGARAAKGLRGRSSPTVCPSTSVRAVDGSQGVGLPIVKKVKNASCTFGAATSSPSVPLSATLLTDSHDWMCETPRAQDPQIGRERPQIFGFQPPKKFLGSLPARCWFVVCAFFCKCDTPHLAGVTACVRQRERALSNRPYAAPHTACPTRLHDERRRVLVTRKGTT